MKKILASLLCTTFVLTSGCKKQPEASLTNKSDAELSQEFEAADEKISQYLDQLDDPDTPLERRKQILCNEWPEVYEQQYSPALIKLAPEYTPEKLKQDFELAANYYKERDKISCN